MQFVALGDITRADKKENVDAIGMSRIKVPKRGPPVLRCLRSCGGKRNSRRKGSSKSVVFQPKRIRGFGHFRNFQDEDARVSCGPLHGAKPRVGAGPPPLLGSMTSKLPAVPRPLTEFTCIFTSDTFIIVPIAFYLVH